MRSERHTERGAAALMVAGSLVFLFGMAALAVDTSGFYQTARTMQTTADLACLAGAAELPDSGKAMEMAHAYAVTNWSEMAGTSLPSTGNPRSVPDGTGNTIVYEVLDDETMRVSVVNRDPTTFGRVLGTDSVNVAQQATCERTEAPSGAGVLPMAALPGQFNGRLHDCAAKVTGNCGNLDSGSGAKDWGEAIADGIDQQLEKHHGSRNQPDPQTGHAVIDCPSAGPCSAADTETGNMQGKFRSGLETRLSRTAGASCTIGGIFNCDSMADVFGSQPPTLEAAVGTNAPGWWEPSLYGNYSAVRTSQYYFDGDIAKCDSPRLATIPIVANDLDWDLGDSSGTWPNGKKTMKVVGFYLVYIREPDTPGEVGSGPVIADVVHLGPNATCNGAPYNPFQTGLTSESVKLVES